MSVGLDLESTPRKVRGSYEPAEEQHQGEGEGGDCRFDVGDLHGSTADGGSFSRVFLSNKGINAHIAMWANVEVNRYNAWIQGSA